jgi:hypothetical protein
MGSIGLFTIIDAERFRKFRYFAFKLMLCLGVTLVDAVDDFSKLRQALPAENEPGGSPIASR